MNNVKAFRKSRNMTLKELGRLCDISESSIQRIEQGTRKPSFEVLLKLTDALECTSEELFGIREAAEIAKLSPVPVQSELERKYNALDDHGRGLVDLVLDAEYKRCIVPAEPEKIVYIRHYLVPAAAGYASPIEGDDYEDIPLPDGAPPGADFCITVRGDSMEPYIPDGSLAYVRRGASLQEFDVGVFYVDGDALVKQWCVDYAGTLHLLSANPAREDANRQIPKTSASTVVCFGKVLLDHRLPRPIYD